MASSYQNEKSVDRGSNRKKTLLSHYPQHALYSSKTKQQLTTSIAKVELNETEQETNLNEM